MQLFVAFDFPSLPLDVFARGWPAALHTRPFVIDSGGHVPRIVTLNDAARACGLRESMLLSAAYALCPELVQQARDPAAEQAALEQLATIALGYTPGVSLVPPTAWVADIGASLRLFGGRERLVAHLADSVRDHGFAPRIGVAPTAIAALALARAGGAGHVVEAAMLARVLERLSLEHFDVEPEARATLAAAGVHTFGAIDRLPRGGVARRFGTALVDLLDRATGRQPDPRNAYSPPPHFSTRLELPAPVHDVEALGFAVNRLVQSLASWLLARGLGVVELSLALSHEHALVRQRDSACTSVRIALAAPSRTPKHLMHVVRERLARLTLPAPAAAIALASETVAPLTGRNLRLLPGDEGLVPEVPVIDRLRARLGEDAVTLIAPHAEHRPELASHDVAPLAPAGGTRKPTGTRRRKPHVEPRIAMPSAPRPVWLLAQPQPLGPMLERQPWILREGPERIESGWWDGRDVRRDYYVAESPRGEIVWIFRDHRFGTDDGEWYLHGVFG